MWLNQLFQPTLRDDGASCTRRLAVATEQHFKDELHMKYLIILIFISISFHSSAYADDATDARIKELLTHVDISHPYYGNDTYGSPKAELFEGPDHTQVLSYQARYGGDGEHTENILKLFTFKGNKPKMILEQNIDSVQFEVEKGILKSIKGKYVETLCDICDGWDVSEPGDIFFIPIKIDINTLTVKADLTQQEKNELLSRFMEQTKKTSAEQLSYGNKSYPEYVETVKKRIMNVLYKTE